MDYWVSSNILGPSYTNGWREKEQDYHKAAQLYNKASKAFNLETVLEYCDPSLLDAYRQGISIEKIKMHIYLEQAIKLGNTNAKRDFEIFYYFLRKCQ